MAVVLARELNDHEIVVSGGVRSVVPMAATFLAQRMHAPNITLLLGMGVVNPSPTRIWPTGGDERYATNCEAYVGLDEIFEWTEQGRIDVAFYGGLQIDRCGSCNLTWVNSDGRGIRGPGVANAALGLTAGRILLYAEHHAPRVFVPEVDFVTVPGHVEGRPDEPVVGAGPVACVTPLGVFRFPRESPRFTAATLHPGVSWDQVKTATGFEVRRPSELPSTPEPTADELSLLREIDRDGLLSAPDL
jgi:glutaconate CoA-transferase subunit B